SKGRLHIADLIYADQNVARLRPRKFAPKQEGFAFSDCGVLEFGRRKARNDLDLCFDPPLDLRDEVLNLLMLHEGETADLSVALSSATGGGSSNASELHLGNVKGFSAAQIRPCDLRQVDGATDF